MVVSRDLELGPWMLSMAYEPLMSVSTQLALSLICSSIHAFT